MTAPFQCLRIRNLLGHALPAATISAMLVAGTAAAGTNQVSGEAAGLLVDISQLGVEVKVGPFPKVTLPSDGGMDQEEVLKIRVPDVISSDTLNVITSGSIRGSAPAAPTKGRKHGGSTTSSGPSGGATSQSSASVENLDILAGLVSADVVVAMCNSTGDGSSASSNAAGSAFIGLSVAGKHYGNITPAPNTKISVLGVGEIILNEQIVTGDGSQTSGITVNMIHVKLNGLINLGDIVISSAQCGVDYTPEDMSLAGFMTGGGRIGDNPDFATFGFNAGSRNGTLRGQLQYNDHGRFLKVHGTSVDSFSLLSDEGCATFAGDARVNGDDGYRFTVTFACDKGEPGVGVDSISIAVQGPSLNYSRNGVLTGGNLQLH